jgi:uncharacterized protein (TIGR02118 family)
MPLALSLRGWSHATGGRHEVDQAVNGPYIAIGHFYFESAEALEAASNAPTAGHAWADVPNFTNAQPVMQVSQIVE